MNGTERLLANLETLPKFPLDKKSSARRCSELVRNADIPESLRAEIEAARKESMQPCYGYIANNGVIAAISTIEAHLAQREAA